MTSSTDGPQQEKKKEIPDKDWKELKLSSQQTMNKKKHLKKIKIDKCVYVNLMMTRNDTKFIIPFIKEVKNEENLHFLVKKKKKMK